jgi:hypothetical protein
VLRSVHSTFTRTFPLFIIPALLLLFLLNGDKGLLRLVTVLFAVLVILALHYAVQSIPFANNAEKAEAQDHLSGRGSLLEDQCFFRISLLLVGLITLAAGIMQANFLHWSHGSDGYSYLQIARDYANGEFAVRGYWSPLISWLTAILMKVGLSPEMAIRYVIVLSGLATVSLVVLLAKRFNLRRGAILALAALTALLVVSQTKVTADLIGVATLLLYILVILHPRVEEKPVQMGALGGFIAAIAYFARSYNLTFIIAHLIIYALYVRLQKGSVKPALRFISVLLLTMVIVVSPWIYSLSNRYHHLTFSTSALHTRGLVAPGARDWSTCMNGSVLCDHPTDIMFPWEDHLPELQPNYNWSPFSSAGNLKHQLKLTASNIIYVIRLNIGWSIMGVICLVCLALFWNDKKYRNMALFLLLTAGLYSGGYMMTLANGGIRYFVVPYILVFLLLVYTVQYVRSRVPEQKKGSFLALSVAALLAILD